MTRILIASLALLAGCGNALPSGTIYVPKSGQPLPAAPSGVKADTPAYVITGNAGANVPLGTYGITTNGLTWYLEWQGDRPDRTFSGDIYCEPDCSLTFINFNDASPGSSFQVLGLNHFHFDDPRGGTVHQHLEFDVPRQPVTSLTAVTFDLKIDGKPATNPATAFPSGGALCSVEVMPFSLVGSR